MGDLTPLPIKVWLVTWNMDDDKSHRVTVPTGWLWQLLAGTENKHRL